MQDILKLGSETNGSAATISGAPTSSTVFIYYNL
jgi:hypothetical protein